MQTAAKNAAGLEQHHERQQGNGQARRGENAGDVQGDGVKEKMRTLCGYRGFFSYKSTMQILKNML